MIASAALVLSAAGACTSPSGPPTRAMDLVREFEHAEVRPARELFQIGDHAIGGTVRLSIAAPVPSRAIWVTPLPRRATLSVFVGLLPSDIACRVRFRIGISDDRIYEALGSHTEDDSSTWTQQRIDLSRYAGLKFSIFYQPEGAPWRVVLSADQLAGAPCTAVWGEPAVETDMAAARQFAEQRPAASR